MTIQLSGPVIAGFDAISKSITTEASITATGSATGDTCIGTGAFTLVNGGTYWVQVFTPYLTKGTTNLDIELFQGHTAATGTFLQTLTGHMTASDILGSGNSFLVKQTLTAGANELTVTGFVDGGTGKFGAGDGATGHAPPAWIRLFTT